MKVTETLERTAAFLSDRVKLGLLDTVAKGLARMVCKLQSGYVRQYALAILLGVAAIMAWFIFT